MDLPDRHFRAVINCPDHWRVRNTWAITWRPGPYHEGAVGNFDTAVKPRTAPVVITQCTTDIYKVRGRQRAKIAFNGYLTKYDPSTAGIHIGGPTANCFAYDFGLRPHAGAWGRVLDHEKNPDLVRLGLEMFRIRQATARKNYVLPTVPKLPKCYLGYTPPLPEMQDSPALRKRVASTLRKPVEYVDAMSEEERDPLLRAEWSSCFTAPQDNGTRFYLINQQLCSVPPTAEFLDFEDLLGVELYNPASRFNRVRSVPNPATSVLKAAGLSDPDWSESVTEELEKELLTQMRAALHPADATIVDDDALRGALLDTEKPLPIPHPVDLPDLLGSEKAVVDYMRRHAGRYGNCCIEEDLIRAAENPTQPLYAARLCRVQVLQSQDDLVFSEEDLGLQRVTADFTNTRWQT